MKKLKTRSRLKSARLMLPLLLLVACASPDQSLIQSPPPPKPQATATMMRTLPEPSSFRTGLHETFSQKPTAPTK